MRPPWLLFSQQTGRWRLLTDTINSCIVCTSVVHLPSVSTSQTDNTQRRTLEANEQIGDNGDVEKTENGSDDIIVCLRHRLAALYGASVAVVVTRGARWGSRLRI